ncbi:Ubiquitin carboxyl-terminal hydrolase 7, ICP0-binding domain containing protein, partial [Parasponia andersonii]
FLCPVAPPEKTGEDVLLFCKLYDPWKEEMRYAGRLFAKRSGTPSEILTKLNKMAGFSRSEEIDLFEIEDGDIICFQKSQARSQQCLYPDVASFLEYLCEHRADSVKAHQEMKPIDSQTSIPDTHVTGLRQSPRNLTLEQSTQTAVPSTVISPPEQLNLISKTNVCPQPTVIEAAIGSSFALFDALFADIQSLLEAKTSEADSLSSFQPSMPSINEIADARKSFKQCSDMELASIIQSGRMSEFKNSVSVISTADAGAVNIKDYTTKFLDEFDQICGRYLSSKFTPIRNRADEVDQEIADLERQLAERKAEKAQLWSNLEDLAGNATTSRQDLISAEHDMRQFRLRKEEAEKTVDDVERSWESLKELIINTSVSIALLVAPSLEVMSKLAYDFL